MGDEVSRAQAMRRTVASKWRAKKKKKKVRPFPPPLALFVLHGAMFAWSWELQHMPLFLGS